MNERKTNELPTEGQEKVLIPSPLPPNPITIERILTWGVLLALTGLFIWHLSSTPTPPPVPTLTPTQPTEAPTSSPFPTPSKPPETSEPIKKINITEKLPARIYTGKELSFSFQSENVTAEKVKFVLEVTSANGATNSIEFNSRSGDSASVVVGDTPGEASLKAYLADTNEPVEITPANIEIKEMPEVSVDIKQVDAFSDFLGNDKFIADNEIYYTTVVHVHDKNGKPLEGENVQLKYENTTVDFPATDITGEAEASITFPSDGPSDGPSNVDFIIGLDLDGSVYTSSETISVNVIYSQALSYDKYFANRIQNFNQNTILSAGFKKIEISMSSLFDIESDLVILKGFLDERCISDASKLSFILITPTPTPPSTESRKEIDPGSCSPIFRLSSVGGDYMNISINSQGTKLYKIPIDSIFVVENGITYRKVIFIGRLKQPPTTQPTEAPNP
jgi:hypothetical protein